MFINFICFHGVPLFAATATYYGWTQWSGFTPCDKYCMKERERYCYNSGNVRACGGNVNDYGIEAQKVKCGRDECPGKNSSSNLIPLPLLMPHYCKKVIQQLSKIL